LFAVEAKVVTAPPAIEPNGSVISMVSPAPEVNLKSEAT